MKESSYPITAAQLRRAATIQEKIEELQNELISIFSSADASAVKIKAKGRGKGKGKGKRKSKDVDNAVAEDAGAEPARKKSRRKRRQLSPESREAIASAQRKRWADFNSKKTSA